MHSAMGQPVFTTSGRTYTMARQVKDRPQAFLALRRGIAE